MSDKVSIIVPAYIVDEEVARHAHSFAVSLREHTKRDEYELIIVDNGSPSEHSWQLIADIAIKTPTPIGYARAVNMGLKLATCERIVVSNVDITLNQGWLDLLSREYDRLGPGVISPDDSGRSGEWVESWYGLWMTDRSVLDSVGLLDESLPYRFHDQNHSIRTVSAGYSVMRSGAVQVGHHNSSTYSKMNLGEQEQKEREEMIRRWGHAEFQGWYEATKTMQGAR